MEYRIPEICQIIGGGTPKTSVPEYWNGDICWLSVKDFAGDSRYVYDTEKKITELGLKNSSTKLLQKDDIIISARGTVGEMAMIPFPMAFNQSCFGLRGNEKVDKTYLFYLLKTKIRELKKQANGAVFDTITISTFNSIICDLPSIEIQKRIAAQLSEIDDKINVNRRICENLEGSAQALFKHWFIDFAPFKDGQFVESELGMVPEELVYQRIEEMPHTLETGKRPSGGVKGIVNGVPSIGAENIKGLGCYDFSKTKFVPWDFAASMKKGKINGYELLIYKDGGKPGYFIPNFAIFGEGYPYDEMCLNEHVFKLDFKNKGYSLFAYFFFKTKQIMSYLNAQGAKAAIPGINSKDIDAIMMPSLENECVKNYCNEVENVITKILILSKESARLATLRDTLLPKLMSGQIEV